MVLPRLLRPRALSLPETPVKTKQTVSQFFTSVLLPHVLLHVHIHPNCPFESTHGPRTHACGPGPWDAAQKGKEEWWEVGRGREQQGTLPTELLV